MKKSSFTAMVMGTIGGILFAIGMCLALVSEWNGFIPGLVIGGLGLVVLIATLIRWRKMVGKEPVRLTGRTIGIILLGVVGALLFGFGMACVMVWSKIVLGIILGTVGILAIISLVPIVKGIETSHSDALASAGF